MVLTFEFDKLPAAVRQRLEWAINSATSPYNPIVAERHDFSVQKPLVVAILAALTGLAFLFLRLGSPGYAWQGWRYAVFYAILAFIFLAAMCKIVSMQLLRKSLPIPAGRYLFALDLLDASTSLLRVISLSDLVRIEPVQQYPGSSSAGFILHFADSKEAFKFSNIAAAQEVLRAFLTRREAANRYWTARDWEHLVYYDPFFELRSMNWQIVPNSRDSSSASFPEILHRPVLLALALALPISLPVWGIRNLISDQILFRWASRENTENAYAQYVIDGWFYKKKIEKDLPCMALEKARKTGTVAALQGVIDRYPSSDLVAEIRNEIPNMALQEARRAGTEAAFLTLLEKYPDSQIVTEARKELPKVALQEALRAGTVTALRGVMQQYPDPLIETRARREINFIFVRYKNLYHASAPSDDSLLLSFMERLMTFQEENNNSKMEIRFKTPSAASLERKSGISYVATHFETGTATQHENRVTQQLVAGFQTIFPVDVLAIASGNKFSQVEAAKVPTIFVAYEVIPSGIEYQFQNIRNPFGFDRYTAIIMRFSVTMRIPNDRSEFAFKFSSSPPQSILVNYKRSNYLDFGPSPSEVYGTMLDVEFEAFKTKMRSVFFKEGSKAFQQSAQPVSLR